MKATARIPAGVAVALAVSTVVSAERTQGQDVQVRRGRRHLGSSAPPLSLSELLNVSEECIDSVEDPTFIGDGICDSSGGYNTAKCNFDGGDCCPSTCRDNHGLGTALGFDCTGPWHHCRDPLTIENNDDGASINNVNEPANNWLDHPAARDDGQPDFAWSEMMDESEYYKYGPQEIDDIEDEISKESMLQKRASPGTARTDVEDNDYYKYGPQDTDDVDYSSDESPENEEEEEEEEDDTDYSADGPADIKENDVNNIKEDILEQSEIEEDTTGITLEKSVSIEEPPLPPSLSNNQSAPKVRLGNALLMAGYIMSGLIVAGAVAFAVLRNRKPRDGTGKATNDDGNTWVEGEEEDSNDQPVLPLSTSTFGRDGHDEECGHLGHVSVEEAIACGCYDNRESPMQQPEEEQSSDAVWQHYDAESELRSVQQSVKSLFLSDANEAFGEETSKTFDIYVPAGKLGLVLDNSEHSGVPIVHLIQDMSCLKGKVAEGDRLLSVDGVDVTCMDAIFVSKLITRGSRKPLRALTFARTSGHEIAVNKV